jgi:hypothetical protein
VGASVVVSEPDQNIIATQHLSLRENGTSVRG